MGQSPNWAVKYPLVNGHLYSFASIECDLDGLLFAGFTSINYDDPVQPGKLYGTGGVLVGRTPGTNKPTLSMTMLRRDWDFLRSQLAKGSTSLAAYGTKSFSVTVTYHEEALQAPGSGYSPIQIGVPLAGLAAGSASRVDQAGAPESQIVTDVIDRVRVTGVAASNAEGSSASAVVLTCDPWLIRWGGHAGSLGSGATNLDEDAATVGSATALSGQGDGKEGPEPEVNGPTRGASTGEFWYATEDGFEGKDFATNPWDGFRMGGMQVPGLCKVSATPSQIVDRQKPNGSDAAALIVRGYSQAEIDVSVTLWLPSHWHYWQTIVNASWRRPFKASSFDKPALKQAPPVDPLTGKPRKDPITGQPVVLQDPAVVKERAAIDRAIPNTRNEAMAIYHPALAALGIGAAVLTSISAPVAGAEPQTFTVNIKMTEYISAPPATRGAGIAKRVAGVAVSPTVTPPLIPALPSSLYYISNPANDPATTPASTESGPNASFTPSYLPK